MTKPINALLRLLRERDTAALADLLRAQVALARARVIVLVRRVGGLVAPAPTTGACADEPALDQHARARARALALAVHRVAEHGIVRGNCLARAIALQSLLASAGLPVGQLRIGVRRGRAPFAAHAWIELGGEALGESDASVRDFHPVRGLQLRDFAR
jgi:hypothetical protein